MKRLAHLDTKFLKKSRVLLFQSLQPQRLIGQRRRAVMDVTQHVALRVDAGGGQGAGTGCRLGGGPALGFPRGLVGSVQDKVFDKRQLDLAVQPVMGRLQGASRRSSEGQARL